MPRASKRKSTKAARESDEDESEVFYVEAIRGKRVLKTGVKYQVKWLGYPESDNSWEWYRHMVKDGNGAGRW